MNSGIPLSPVTPAEVLEVGARLTEAPSTRLADIAFGRELNAQLGLSTMIGWVDLAHSLTLAERSVIPHDRARALIAALLALNEKPASFAPAAPYGDLYTNREAWLAARTEAAGWLGVARARREALTTAYHLVLCEELLRLGDALAATAEALTSLSLSHRDTLLPEYTYLQAAQPTTLGHYLQAFAWPMARDLERIQALYDRVDQSPAGIGSSNGSVIVQDRCKLAERLGFCQPVRHARDAMWQADLALETCTVALAAAINLDRLAEDLMIFASAEFGFLTLADRHARASKIMPQKRNPFVLAFIRATANRLIGVQAGVAAAARTPSAQMDNRLFVYEAVPDAVRSAAEIASLAAESLGALTIDASRAREALIERATWASDLAERLIVATGIDYRSAHRVVGRIITALEESGRAYAAVNAKDVCSALRSAGLSADGVSEEMVAAALDPATSIAARADLGCAAPEEVSSMASSLSDAIRESRQAFAKRRERRESAFQRLHAEAKAFVGSAG